MEARDSRPSEAEVFLRELNGALALPPQRPRPEAEEVRYLRDRVRALRHEKASLRVELANARRECAGLREELGGAKRELERARVAEEAALREGGGLRQELADARRQAERSAARLAELTALLEDVYASRSWRLANRVRGVLSALAPKSRPRRAGGAQP